LARHGKLAVKSLPAEKLEQFANHGAGDETVTQRLATLWKGVNETTTKVIAGWQEWRRTTFWRSFIEAWRWGFAALFRPIPTLQRAADEKPIFASVWLTLLQGLSLAIGTRYAAEHEGVVLSLLVKNLPSWGWVILYAFLVPPVIWFLKAAVLNLVAELLGGPPRGLSLLATTAIACSPLLLVFPVALLAVAFAQPDLNEGFVSHLWFVFAIGVHAWWGVLTVFAVRETYRFTLAQAFLTVLLPLLIGLPVAFLIYLVLTVVA
jgi:hypothetical protein